MDIDYKTLPIEIGDLFIMTTDGIHDYLSDKELKQHLKEFSQLELLAKDIISHALNNKSHDNVSCQIIQVDELPEQDSNEVFNQLLELPFPPELEAGNTIDGYRIIKEISASSTSQLYLVEDPQTHKQMIMKTPSINFEDDPSYLEQFYIEEWAGKRLNHENLLITYEQTQAKNFLYILMEYIEGITLSEWIKKNPQPEISRVINILEQIIKGVRAIHRMEMLHRDLKPDNIMITPDGKVKIIDFGSIKIAGLQDVSSPVARNELMGTKNYTAPEYLLGITATKKSELFSVGIVAYEMLTAKHPYAEQLDKYSKADNINKLRYIPCTKYNPMIPLWIDGALKKAVRCDHRLRYDNFSEFLYDLQHPNEKFLLNSQPFMEKKSVLTWQLISAVLLISNLIMFYLLSLYQ